MPLRLATWNCHHGELRTRAALLDGLRPDIVALQECSAPVPAGRDVAWEGFSPGKGVGVRVGAGSEVALVSDATAGGRSARLFQLSGAVTLQLLVFWAHREPTYVRGVAAALDAYATAIRSAPTVLLGDFNSNKVWDGDEPDISHSTIVLRLRDEFGLVSAYHAFHGEAQGAESQPTIFWRWDPATTYHVDYCFVTQSWAEHIRAVTVGGCDGADGESDHMPVSLELAIGDTAPATETGR